MLGGPDVRIYDLDGNVVDNGSEFEEWWPGSWDVAGYSDDYFMAVAPASNRRASVRQLLNL
jgi:hypothetical protein